MRGRGKPIPHFF
jgi:hypothetical protein